jgi:hypothetical protein
MIDSDKIVSLNSLVEHTDLSVLKNIIHISGGPLSIASAGKTIVYPNKKITEKISISRNKNRLKFDDGAWVKRTDLFQKMEISPGAVI